MLSHESASSKSLDAFHQIIALGDLEGLKDKLSHGMTPEHRNARGEPPLYTAVAARQWSVAAYLIARGAHPIFPAHLPATFLHQGLLQLNRDSIESLFFLLTYLPNMLGYEVIHLVDAHGLTPGDLILIQGKKNNWPKHEQLRFLSLLHQASAEKICDKESFDSLSSLIAAQEKFDQNRLILREEKATTPQIREEAFKELRKVCRDEFNSIVKSFSIHQSALTHVLLEWSKRSLVLKQDLEAMQYAAAAFYHSSRQPEKSMLSSTLQQINRILHASLTEDNKPLPSYISFDLVTYHQLLYDYRSNISESKNTISSFPAKNISVVSDFLKDNTSFFKELAKKLFNEALKIYGKKRPSHYALLGLGSMARNEMCPYSDLECALLVPEEKPEILEYFKQVIQIFRLLLTALGEIPLSIELVEGQTSLCIKGFHLDEDYNPLNPGMMGNISTLLNVQKNPAASRLQKHALRKICVITDSDPSLAQHYQQQLDAYWKSSASDHPMRQLLPQPLDWTQAQNKALEAMQYLEYPTELNRRRPTDPIQLKKEFTSFLVQFISHLSLFYGITENNTDTCLKKLEEANKISKIGLRHLRDVLSAAFHLRILSQLHYGEDRDELHISETQSNLSPALFKLDNEKIHRLYQVLLPVEEAAKMWTTKKAACDFRNYPFFATADLLEAKAYERHAGLETASALYDTLIHQDPLNIEIRVQSLKCYYMQYEVACRTQASEVIKKSKLNKVSSLIANLITHWHKKSYASSQYLAVYKRLSPELRKYFRQELLHYQYKQKLNPKDAAFFSELAIELNMFPDEDGQREEWIQHKQQWIKTLESLVFSWPDTESKIALTSPLLLQKNPDTSFVLKPDICDALFTPEKRFKEHKIQGSQRNVIPIDVKLTTASSEGKSEKTVYFKENPELSGMSYLMERLHHQLLGHGTSLSELVRINIPNHTPLPILVSEGIPGENFDDILRYSPEKLDDLSHYHFSGLVLLAILTNPGDGKPSNYIFSPLGNGQFTLISVDHDHALFPAYLEEEMHLSERDKKSEKIVHKPCLQVRSILFCLDQMKKPIDAKLASEFCEQVDPYKVLRTVLQQAVVQNDYYKNLFNTHEVKSLHQKGKGTIPIPIKEGDIINIFKKMSGLQDYLKRYPKATLLECLLYVEPRIGLASQKALQDPLSPRERLQKMGDYPLDAKGHMLTKTSALVSRRLVGSILSKEGYLALETFNPAKGLAELEQMAYQHSRLTEIQEEVQKGEYYRFAALLSQRDQETILCGDLQEETGAGQLREQKGLMPLEWKKLNDIQQKELLTVLTKIPLQRLQLDYCQSLTPEFFMQLLAISPDLYELHIEGYHSKEINALPQALNNHPTLRFLYLRDNLLLNQLDNMFLPSLNMLVTDRCQQLKIIAIYSPQLKILRTKKCPNLTSIVTSSQQLEVLDCRENKSLTPTGLSTATEAWFALHRVDFVDCPELLPWNRFMNYPFALMLIVKKWDTATLDILKLKLDLLTSEENIVLRNKKSQLIIISALLFIEERALMFHTWKVILEALRGKPSPTYSGNNAHQNSINALSEIIAFSPPNFAKSAITALTPVLISEKYQDRQDMAFTALNQIAKANQDISETIFQLLQSLLKNPNKNIRHNAIKTLQKIGPYVNLSTASKILEITSLSINVDTADLLPTEVLGKVVQTYPILVKKCLEILKSIIEVNKNKYKDEGTLRGIVIALGEIVQVVPTLAKEIFNILRPILQKEIFQIPKTLAKILRANPELSDDVLKELDQLFLSGDRSATRGIVNDSWSKIAKINPMIAEKVFNSLHTALYLLKNDRDFFDMIRRFIDVAPASLALGEKVFNFFQELLKADHEELKKCLIDALSDVVRIYPTLLQQASKKLQKLLKDKEKENQKIMPTYRRDSSKSMYPSELVDPSLSGKSFNTLKRILKQRKHTEATPVAFVEMIKDSPNLAEEAFHVLKPLLNENDEEGKKEYETTRRSMHYPSLSYARQKQGAVILACAKIVKYSPSIAKDIFHALKPFIGHHDSTYEYGDDPIHINLAAISALTKIAETVPMLSKKIFKSLNYPRNGRDVCRFIQPMLKTNKNPRIIFESLLLMSLLMNKSELKDYASILICIKTINDLYGLHAFDAAFHLDSFLDDCLLRANTLIDNPILNLPTTLDYSESPHFSAIEAELVSTFSLFKSHSQCITVATNENIDKISKIIRGYLV